MTVLAFSLGLAIGLTLLVWQRSRFHAKLQRVLRELRTHSEESSLSSTSRLVIAVARQQQVQQELEQQIVQYRQILNMAPVGYVQVDDENRLIWCNTQAQKLLLLPEDHGPTPRLLLELVRSYELDALIEQTRDRQHLCQKDWTYYPVSPDPSQLSQQQKYALRGLGFPLAGEQVGIFLENRQEAVTLMNQRDRWASDMAHELKTPLTSIRLVAETLQSRLDAPLRGWVDRLVNETIRLSNLVQDLLDLSLLDREPSQALRWQRTNLAELVQSAWLNLEPLARKKHLRLDYDGPDHLLIELDEARIYRVLINLLDNSIKYSPPRQSVRVVLSEVSPAIENSPRRICLEVIDTGPGFPEGSLPHVFERFFRADPARTRSGDPRSPLTFAARNGTPTEEAIAPSNASTERTDPPQRSSSGLGLAIVRQIVEAHSGSVSASNHPETGGAWLKVYLPLTSH